MTEQPTGFGAELRRRRTMAGQSLGDFARSLNYSKGYLSKIENGQKRPSAEVARRCDVALEADGKLAALLPPVPRRRNGGTYSAWPREAIGAQAVPPGTRIIPAGDELTWSDGVAPPPLADGSGVIDSPYRGLSVFGERDAAFFFGREADAARVLERMSRCLAGPGLLVVSGVSGAGKSSLLRAGVLARMREAGLTSAHGSRSWPCLLLTPAHAPLDELAVAMASLAGADAATVRRGLDADPAGFALTARQAALAQPPGQAGDRDGPGPTRSGRRVLVMVDQFEQLFTQCPDERERRAFLTALYAAATAGHGPDQVPAALVVLVVRADFEARCADYPQLAAAVQDRYLVTSMTARQLRMAITEPARTAGSRVGEDLVEILLGEVSTRELPVSRVASRPGAVLGAGALPLLSHALDQAWRNRTGDVLTLTDYERTGGIEGAVSDSAERAYGRLTPAQQAAARQVFTRLTATSSDGAVTAERAGRAELAEGKSAAQARDVEAVLEAFAAERLLILAADTVEISHEVLLTAWPLLRDTWLADTHADRIVRTRLHDVAAEWARGSHDPSYLYSGSLLAAASGTAARIGADPARHPSLSRTERDFLHASEHAHRHSVRRRQSLLAFLMILVIGLAATTVSAIRSSQQAAQQRDMAVSGQLISQSEALGDTNPAISKLESIAAWLIHPSSDARYAMLAAAARPGIAVLNSHAGMVSSVAFSPDGAILATGSLDGTARLWDVATRHPIGSPLTGPASGVSSVAFSPDGTTLATGSLDGTARLWDVATRRQIGSPLTSPNIGVSSVAFSPDGTTLATGSLDGTVRLWDVTTRRQIGNPLGNAVTSPNIGVSSVAFSPDGTTLASGNLDGTVRLWDVTTRRQTGHRLTGQIRQVLSVAFSPDGKTLASGGDDGTVRLWDVATRHQIGSPLTGPASGVSSVAFSPDGAVLASGSLDGAVRLWDVATRRQIGSPLIGHTDGVSSVAFSPDGTTLASGSLDGTVRLWNVASSTGSGIATSSASAVSSVAFSPDGAVLASGNLDGTVRLWDVTFRRQIGSPLTGHTSGVFSVAFSPDGTTLASGSLDGTVRLWNVATRHQIGSPLTGSPLTADIGVSSVAFSPDGTTLASGNLDGTVRLWEVATRRQIGSLFTGHTYLVSSVAFSPDGEILASGSLDGTVRLWDVATRHQIGSPLTGPASGVSSVAFSPDSTTLASGSLDGTARLWNVATRHQIGSPLGNPRTSPNIGVSSVAFSPDGTILASGSLDGTVRLWDVATRQQIGNPLAGPISQVYSVAFSPDGKTLATGSSDGTVRLWNVSYTTDIIAYLCATAARSLTRAEWARYVPPGPAYQSVCP